MPTALITGITGQDGSHLAELLLEKGYEVHGIVRRTSLPNMIRLQHLSNPRFVMHEGDMHDQSSITRIMFRVKPDEVYNLAAQSFVGGSWDQPDVTADITGLGAVRVYEAARQLFEEYGESPRIYQASTSEMFGNAPHSPQNEVTPFAPHSPYGCAKLYAHEMARVYRDSYGMFIACGILFNHEGPRRGEHFVTRKITKAVCEIMMGNRTAPIELGNLNARRDWGFAGDYVEAMWLMLQQDEPEDFVIGTGSTHSVKQFLDVAFLAAGLKGSWEKLVTINPKYVRPVDINELRADPSKAQEKLGWSPKTTFHELVKIMVDADAEKLAERQKNSAGA